MKQLLDRLMQEERIDAYAPLPFSETRPVRAYLLERIADFTPKTALMLLIPYYAGPTENLSLYAAARDYHAYMQGLFSRLCPRLTEATPYRFFGFSDHSPIHERHAAASAGLGAIGENGLLLHERYGSFVFIGELITDAPPEALGYTAPAPLRRCSGCGACRRACPGGILRGESEFCLSAVTQKKGELTEEEKALLLQGGSVWGCDACQTACPHNRARIRDGRALTPIPYFREERLTRLTHSLISEMSDAEFAARAFSFRGRAPLLRNLALLGDSDLTTHAPTDT